MPYPELCDALAERFGSSRSLAEDKRVFRMRKKQPGETYAHMAQDLARLARRIYQRDPRMADQEARDLFVKGLPPRIQLAVAAANPRTLAECVDSVSQLQVVLGTEALEEVAETPLKSQATWSEGKPNGTKKGQSSSEKGGRGKKNRRKGEDVEVRCWDCGEIGHYRNKCPLHNRYKPAQSSGKSAPQTGNGAEPPKEAGKEEESSE